VDLSAICSNAVSEHATVRLLTPDGSVEVEIPNGDTARPGQLRITDAGGTRLAPTLYESGHRATWRRLHRLLATGQPSVDVDELAADIATATKTPLSQAN